MKKLVFVLLLLVPTVVIADRRSDYINKILEYENAQTDYNIARINAYGVNQEKLDIYRNSHPRYNFPATINELNKKQAKQILSYFWDNYRFNDYKYDEIQEKVWDIMIHISMTELDKKINDAIREYYKFNNNFYTPFGSVASVSLLNGMQPKNVPDFYLILDKITY